VRLAQAEADDVLHALATLWPSSTKSRYEWDCGLGRCCGMRLRLRVEASRADYRGRVLGQLFLVTSVAKVITVWRPGSLARRGSRT
jgi:hypothetical protein